MALGLTSTIQSKKLITPGIVTDNLVLKHKYDRDSLVPVSNGAVYGDGSTSSNSIETEIVGNDIFEDTTAFTIAGWVNIKEIILNRYQKLVKVSDGTEDRIELYFKHQPADAKLILVIAPRDTGGAAYCHANTTFTDSTFLNKWTHIAATYQPGKTRIYINGKDDTNISGSSAGSTVDIDISAKVSLAEHLNGYACNIGIWNKALTQGELRDIMHKNYAGLSDANKENLQHWWNLDELISTANIADKPDIVLNQHAGSTEVGNWNSYFSGTGIVANADSGSFVSNANPPYTETYIDNDNKTIRLRAISDGPDDGDAIDHVQLKLENVLTIGKTYKFVVTVDSISGRFRIRPGTGSAAADMTTTGVHTFYFHGNPSTYWRVERDFGVGDITISNIQVYDIGYTGEL
tara:strand:+ start:436 stop:1650 length:1215 start_codon:yes stop_codon:yes gene_type:complete